MDILRAGSRLCLWSVGLWLGVACGIEGGLPTPPSSLPPPPTPPSQASISISVSPSPIDAVVGPEGSPWIAEWTVSVREIAGIGGGIDFVKGTLTDPGGSSIAETEVDADEVATQLGGSNRIRGGSTQVITMTLSFDFPGEDSSGNLKVTTQVTDDFSNVLSASADDVVRVCIPTLVAPLDAASLDNGCTVRENGVLWEFDWSDCSGADNYHIMVTPPDPEIPTIDRPELTASSFTFLDSRSVPEEARFGWKWMVRARFGSTWSEWSEERTFDVEPINSDCVTP